MEFEFSGKMWFWKGPAPWHFITVPAELGLDLNAMASALTYGWGMIPANVLIGDTEWRTALWPRDGSYIVPIKAAVRKLEDLKVGDQATVHLEIG
ncbi:MAG TPA: DUF1905 domain-containing protein [Promineifilum sp.]|nr:DUF1905 domain-containing protein [Promineifilum sp.]HRO91338.1 DUF1905 domain-containing protein [Promineifilum sp.]HRQ13545.1 DUF1905 domain-containing protein [Promineifilum sp.]